MVEVRMDGGDDFGVVVVLDVRQPFGKKAAVVIVDQCDRADDIGIGSEDGGGHQVIADKVAQCFRPVGIALVFDESIKLLQ